MIQGMATVKLADTNGPKPLPKPAAPHVYVEKGFGATGPSGPKIEKRD